MRVVVRLMLAGGLAGATLAFVFPWIECLEPEACYPWSLAGQTFLIVAGPLLFLGAGLCLGALSSEGRITNGWTIAAICSACVGSLLGIGAAALPLMSVPYVPIRPLHQVAPPQLRTGGKESESAEANARLMEHMSGSQLNPLPQGARPASALGAKVIGGCYRDSSYFVLNLKPNGTYTLKHRCGAAAAGVWSATKTTLRLTAISEHGWLHGSLRSLDIIDIGDRVVFVFPADRVCFNKECPDLLCCFQREDQFVRTVLDCPFGIRMVSRSPGGL